MNQTKSKKELRDLIALNLENIIVHPEILELGTYKKGKVRNIYRSKAADGSNVLIMPISDRVSAFDYILNKAIPYKGIVLNEIAKWSFEQTSDIVHNALIGSPDPHVVVQKEFLNLGIECVVRGYMWGSLANEYENGAREKYGICFNDAYLRYEKFNSPIFTPTTKAESGHDMEISYIDMSRMIGEKINSSGNFETSKFSSELREIVFKLYQRGDELARKAGLILIDTKYEFGIDDSKNLYLIDEIHTPDSSRYAEIDDYNKKWPKIEKEMKTGKYANVSELLKAKPELKIVELSKQVVRDVLIGRGYTPESGKVPLLEDSDVIETSARYIELYERLTGKKFNYFDKAFSDKMTENLVNSGYAKPYAAIILAGSGSDEVHIRKIYDELAKWGIPASVRIISAHKQPSKLEETIKELNQRKYATALIAVAGGIDALSGVLSYHSIWPVISCPPDKNTTVLGNPSGSSNSVIYEPSNVAKHVAQYFCIHDDKLKEKLQNSINVKIKQLDDADKDARSGKLIKPF